jgi:hypothetical protein
MVLATYKNSWLTLLRGSIFLIDQIAFHFTRLSKEFHVTQMGKSVILLIGAVANGEKRRGFFSSCCNENVATTWKASISVWRPDPKHKTPLLAGFYV